MPIKVYPGGAESNVKNVYVYVGGQRRKVKTAYAYPNGQRRVIYSSYNPNFTMVAGAMIDNLEGSGYGNGVGLYDKATDNDGTTVPTFPPQGVGGAPVVCLFTSNGNSGDVGLPQNLLIYVVDALNVPNTNATFTTLTIPGIGTFSRAAAQYFGNSLGKNQTEWRWTTGGPYFTPNGNYTVTFT